MFQPPLLYGLHHTLFHGVKKVKNSIIRLILEGKPDMMAEIIERSEGR
jgi:hypothetical protein